MRIVQNGPENVVNALQQLPGQLSRVQSKGVAQIHADYQDRRAALVLEQARLAARYGARSEQARLAQARVDRFDAAGAALAAEVERSSMKTPDPDPKGFVVYGRVIDRKGAAVVGVQVSAIGAEGAVLAGAKSSDRGVYSFTVPVAKDQAAGQFHLKVSDGREKTLLTDSEILEPAAGQVAYRELVVNVPGAAQEG